MTAAWRFYFLMPVRAWKATAPDLTGHRPQIAGNRNADRIARPSPLPAKPYPLKTAQAPLYAVGVVPTRRKPQSGRISALAGRRAAYERVPDN